MRLKGSNHKDAQLRCASKKRLRKEPSLKRASPEQILLIESERLVTAPRNAFATHRAIITLGEHPKSRDGSMIDDRPRV
jgi:hypothetical protein